MFNTDQCNGRNVLIIGGLGFIGSNLAARLVTLGARVMIIDSLIPEYGGNLFNIQPFKDKVTVNISDVRDEHSMRYLVQGHEFLFNLAGQTSHLDSMQNPETDLDINCRAQLKILEACRTQSVHQNRVCQHPAGLRQTGIPAGEWTTSRLTGGCERHQQTGRGVVSSSV